MRVAPIQAVSEFRRRIVVSRFCNAAAVGAFATACALTTAVVLARVCGAQVEPRAWWAGALLVPVAWAAWRSARNLPDAAACAAHVDRKLAFGGLLMTSFEADAGPWRGKLARLLEAAPSAAPPVPWRRTLLFLLASAAVLAPALLLDAPKNATAPSVALAHELQRLEQKIEKVAAANAVDPKTLEILRERSEELSQRAADRGDVGWQEADALDAAIDHAVEERVNAMRSLRDQIDAHLADASTGEGPAELAALLDQAAMESDADGSPHEAGAGSSSRPAAEMTREELQRLAESMSRNLTDRLKSLAEAGLADPEAARRLAAASRKEMARSSGHRHTKECRGGNCSGACSKPGSGASAVEGAGADATQAEGEGGITRGRGDAELRYLNDTQAGSEKFRSEQLPKGAVVGREWTLKSVGLGEPTARPTVDGGAGAAGSTGTGEASPRRRLAPRHRETVRRFFSLDPDGRPR